MLKMLRNTIRNNTCKLNGLRLVKHIRKYDERFKLGLSHLRKFLPN